MSQLIDYNGKIAVSFGWQTDWNEPQEVRVIHVGRAAASRYQHLMGHPIEWTGNVGVIYANRRRFVIDLEDKEEWTKTIEKRPVKKPRRGTKRGWKYDWEWHNGRWERIWV